MLHRVKVVGFLTNSKLIKNVLGAGGSLMFDDKTKHLYAQGEQKSSGIYYISKNQHLPLSQDLETATAEMHAYFQSGYMFGNLWSIGLGSLAVFSHKPALLTIQLAGYIKDSLK